MDEEAEEHTEPAEAGYYWKDLGHVIRILREWKWEAGGTATEEEIPSN